jgi:hypothetical protein
MGNLKQFASSTCYNAALAGTSAAQAHRLRCYLVTVQLWKGHSSAEVTREIYWHSVPADARSAVEKVEALLIGPKWTQAAEATKVTSTLVN